MDDLLTFPFMKASVCRINDAKQGATGGLGAPASPTFLPTSTLAQISINGNVFQPEKSFKFPETIHKKQKRSFQHHWCEKHPWLDYDIQSDSVTCQVCKKQNDEVK